MTTPIQITGWANGLPGVTPVDPLKAILAPLQAQQRNTQKALNNLTARAKSLTGKTNAASIAELKRVNAQIAATKTQLTGVGGKIVTATNNYYKQTGQYEKLLTGTDRDAYAAVQSLFKSYGLDSLAGKIYDYVKNGYSSDTISILLQDTPEYKARFAGNEARKKAGLPVLSPAEYLATEASYQQIMHQSGLPSSFYDQPSDFSKWIGENTSPSEIQSRVDLATQATTLAAPAFRQALNQMGIDDGHLAAYYLDPTKALPLLQKQAATAQIGAEALKQGLAFDQTYAEQLATQGVSQSAAAQGYQQVASELGTLTQLGGIYGQGWTQRESEESVLGGSAAATAKKAALVGQEQGAFAGATGGAQAGLNTSRSPTSG